MKMRNSRMRESMMHIIPRNNYRKRERKTRVPNHVQARQTQMKYTSQIMNMNEGRRDRKFLRMKFKTDKAMRLQMMT